MAQQHGDATMFGGKNTTYGNYATLTECARANYIGRELLQWTIDHTLPTPQYHPMPSTDPASYHYGVDPNPRLSRKRDLKAYIMDSDHPSSFQGYGRLMQSRSDSLPSLSHSIPSVHHESYIPDGGNAPTPKRARYQYSPKTQSSNDTLSPIILAPCSTPIIYSTPSPEYRELQTAREEEERAEAIAHLRAALKGNLGLMPSINNGSHPAALAAIPAITISPPSASPQPSPPPIQVTQVTQPSQVTHVTQVTQVTQPTQAIIAQPLGFTFHGRPSDIPTDLLGLYKGVPHAPAYISYKYAKALHKMAQIEKRRFATHLEYSAEDAQSFWEVPMIAPGPQGDSIVLSMVGGHGRRRRQ